MSQRKKTARRTAQVDRGLLALASIVSNLRTAVTEIDDADEDAAIQATIRWIHTTL